MLWRRLSILSLSALALIPVSALGQGPVQFSAPNYFTIGRDETAAAIGDFNGDHKADVAVSVEGGVAVLLGNGDGTFAPVVRYLLPGNSNGLFVAAGDVNG